MLTPQQKAQAERKLRSLNQEKQHEEEFKSKVKLFGKTVDEALKSIKQQPKKHLKILRNLVNTDFIRKIAAFEATNTNLLELQEKMKNKREQLNKQALLLVEEEGRYKKGIEEIKQNIVNIQKTVKDSVQEQVKKRKKIQDDLQKPLDDIGNKIKQFEADSQNFDKQNAELKEKVDAIKVNLGEIEQVIKAKVQQKDEQIKAERDELSNKLKDMELEKQKAIELNKEYTALQKQNFDKRIALYLKTNKFPEFFASFQNSANTLNLCKQELLKGVHHMNVAVESIEQSSKLVQQINHQYLIELRRQQQRQEMVQQIKKQKQAIRVHIIELQNKLKQKKSKAQA